MKNWMSFYFTWVIFLGGTLQGQECFPPGSRKKSNWQHTYHLRISKIVLFNIPNVVDICMYTKCIYLSIDIFPPREQVKLAAHLWLFSVIFKIVSNYLLSQLSFKYLCSSNWYYIKVTLSKRTNKERFLAASMCNINSYPLIATTCVKIIHIHWLHQYQCLNITFGSGPHVCGMS